MSQTCPVHQPTNLDGFLKDPPPLVGGTHPVFGALQRCAVALGLPAPAAAAFSAQVEAECKTKAGGQPGRLRTEWIDDPLALLIYAVELDSKNGSLGKARIVDFAAYVRGCRHTAPVRYRERAQAMLAKEME